MLSPYYSEISVSLTESSIVPALSPLDPVSTNIPWISKRRFLFHFSGASSHICELLHSPMLRTCTAVCSNVPELKDTESAQRNQNWTVISTITYFFVCLFVLVHVFALWLRLQPVFSLTGFQKLRKHWASIRKSIQHKEGSHCSNSNLSFQLEV